MAISKLTKYYTINMKCMMFLKYYYEWSSNILAPVTIIRTVLKPIFYKSLDHTWIIFPIS